MNVQSIRTYSSVEPTDERSQLLSTIFGTNFALIYYSSVGKESACNVGDLGSIPGLGRSPGEGNIGDLGSIPGLGRSSGEGNGNPLQYSCLENPMDRGAWQAIVHGVTRVGHDLATTPKTKPQSTEERYIINEN